MIGLDFAPALASGRSLASGTVQVLDPSGADVTSALVTSGTATITGSQAKAQLKAGGGSAGTSYTLIFTVTLDDGEILQDGLTISATSIP